MSNLNLIEVNAGSCSVEDYGNMAQFRLDYYLDALAGTDVYSIADYVGKTTLESWRNPNIAAQKGLINPNQSFRDPKITLTYDSEGEYTALAYTANNTSSNLPKPLNRIERAAKFYMPNRKYFAFREVIGNSYEEIEEVLLHALNKAEIAQPIVAYVFSAEQIAINVLLDAGFVYKDADEAKKPMFDATNDAEAVYQLRYDFQKGNKSKTYIV